MICSAGCPTRMGMARLIPDVRARMCSFRKLLIEIVARVLADCFCLDIPGELRRSNHGDDRKVP